MYWTDWEEDEIDDSVGRIEKAWMDGFNRQIFVTSKMLWPNGLTLDFHTSTLYWCDAYYDHIEKVFLNGTHRKVKDKCCWLKSAGLCVFTEPCAVLKILSSLFLPLRSGCQQSPWGGWKRLSRAVQLAFASRRVGLLTRVCQDLWVFSKEALRISELLWNAAFLHSWWVCFNKATLLYSNYLKIL